MRVIDSHVHLWANGTPNPPHRQVNSLSAEELLAEMKEAAVDAAIIQPPNWDANANAVAEAAAKKYPERFGILGWLPLDKPESRGLIDGWKKRPGQLGLRFTFMLPHQLSWPTDGTIDWLWPAAEKAGLPVALAFANFLPLLGQIAGRHPDLKLIIDHFGMPSRAKDAAAFENLPSLLALAKHKNIAVKVSGAPGMSSEPYPFRNLIQPIHAIYDAFGPERMFWGTDITRLSCTWRQCVTQFTEELPFLNARDRELIMGDALCRFYGWNLSR
jgi:predicted TIM-barrel fold metal-dependent hydrolase